MVSAVLHKRARSLTSWRKNKGLCMRRLQHRYTAPSPPGGTTLSRPLESLLICLLAQKCRYVVGTKAIGAHRFNRGPCCTADDGRHFQFAIIHFHADIVGTSLDDLHDRLT